MEHWPAIECDLQDCGVDVGDDVLMEARSIRWLDTRILGLLDKPAQIEPLTGRFVYRTRLQEQVLPQPRSGKTVEK